MAKNENEIPYIFYAKAFPAIYLHARDQDIKQSFCSIIVLPADRPVRPEIRRN